jgi:hypothetical protein
MGTGKNAEYFSHDCNAKDDPKIMLLMAQLGLEAYGIYWILVEYLRQQPGYQAPLILLDPLSRRYGSSKEKFEAVVTRFGLFELDGETFYSPSLNRRMSPLDNKRERMQQLALKRWSKDGDNNAMRTHSVGIAQAMQSKVKKSKVKESKVKKSKEENNTLPDSLPYIDHTDHNTLLVSKWHKWCEFRKLLKKPYKTTPGAAAAYNKLLNIADHNSELAIQIIDQSIENEWLGFFPLKTVARGVKSSVAGEDPVDKLTREFNEIVKNKKSGTDGSEE